MTEQDFNRTAFSAANALIGVAQNRGYTIPEEVSEALAVTRELGAIRNLPTLTVSPVLPSKAADLRKALTDHAATIERDRQLRAAAENAMGPATARLSHAARAATPQWVADLAGDFDKAWATFTSVAPNAPVSMDSGPVSEAAVAAYAATANAAGELDTICGTRAYIGTNIGEDGCDTDRFIGLVAVMPTLPRDPAEFTDQWTKWSAVTGSTPGIRKTALTQIQLQNLPDWEQPAWGDIASGAHRWRRLMTLASQGWTIRLARLGEVERRMADLATWQQAAWDLNVGMGGTGNYVTNRQAGRYRVSADELAAA